MFARCELYSIAYLQMFYVCELWATNEPARDRSGVCKATTQTEVKGCIAFDLTLIMLRCSAFNPNIDELPDCAVLLFSVQCLSSGFCFGQYLMFSCSLGITHHSLILCNLSVP